MNENQLDSPYFNVQDHLCDGIVQKIKNYYTGARLSVLLDEIVSENNIDLTPLHPETVRALCHYASVLAGEATDTAILFEPQARQQWIDSGYESKEITIENEFIIVPRSRQEIQRLVTREPLSKYDLDRRNIKNKSEKPRMSDEGAKPVTQERPRRVQRQIPRHVSNMTNIRRDSF